MESGSYVLAVNYPRVRGLGVGVGIESKEFWVGGHGWTIWYFPEGSTIHAHNSKFISLFINLKTTASTTVQYLFSLVIPPAQSPDEQGKPRKNYVISTFDENLCVTRGVPGSLIGSNLFIRHDILQSGYLRGDYLTIRATVGVFYGDFPIVRAKGMFNWLDCGELLHSQQGADVFFNVRNERFWGHKWLLSARCPAILEEEEIDDIPDMEPKIFEVMLHFVYTGMLLEDEFDDDSDVGGPFARSSFMGKLLAAADRFELRGLKSICESRISKWISGESVAYLLHLAELCHVEELKAACLKFGPENGADLLDVMDSDGREYLKETCASLFLELSYKASANERGEHNLCGKICSTMKGAIVSMLRPHLKIDNRKKVM